MVRGQKVETKYQRVVRKKSRKFDWADEIPVPDGLTPLARYVEENLTDGITVHELVEQFQRYDCEHSWSELAIAPERIYDSCAHCGLILKRKR